MTPTMTPPRPARAAFADRDAAQRALDAVRPLIEPLLAEPAIVGSGFLCVVVLDPTRAPGEADFDDAVLAEQAWGDRSRWDADYAAFARAKAKLAWRLNEDGRTSQARAHRLREGDTLLAGAVCLDGIVVGVSGAHPHYDEAFATCVAAWLRAHAHQGWLDATRQGRLHV